MIIVIIMMFTIATSETASPRLAGGAAVRPGGDRVAVDQTEATHDNRVVVASF